VAASSRRDLVRVLLGVAAAILLGPLQRARALADPFAVLGAPCATDAECPQPQEPMGMCSMTVACAENGFPSDGPRVCCSDGCCQSDDDCCGDMRCAPGYEGGGHCTVPPFPTRSAGQPCASNSDCRHWPGCWAECVSHHCKCSDPIGPYADAPPTASLPDDDAAMAAAETVAALEVAGRIYNLYRDMHPDARAIIPLEAVVGWYENEFTRFAGPPPLAVKVRFITWTWEVTGRTYPDTAEVALRQDVPDGTVARDEVRLVKDDDGNWGWFFGRTRAFVDEQIARYAQPAAADTGALPQEPCTSSEDCSQAEGPAECVRGLRDGVMQLLCLRDTGGACSAADDCLRTMTCNGGVCGSLLAGEARTATQDLALRASPPQRDLPTPGDDRYPPGDVPLLVVPAGSTLALADGGSVFGYVEVEYDGVTGWVSEEGLAP
jgi:hypothetical protein